MSDIAQRIGKIQEQIKSACKRAGRPVNSVKLMGVTKTHPADIIIAGYQAGLRLFGENRVQEFATKKDRLPPMPDASLHLIGHLQSNKTQRATELFDAVDTVDSLKLAERLNSSAGQLNKKLAVLLEVNVGGEGQKAGFAPISKDFEDLLRAAPRLEHLAIRGLMTVPPFRENVEDVRPFFRMLSELRDDIARRKLPGVHMEELSMGMSHDFEVAIEEGATCVRVGSAIFGERPKPLAASAQEEAQKEEA